MTKPATILCATARRSGRIAALVGLWACHAGGMAVLGQWEVPGRLVLDGPAPEDRQVTGIAPPVSADAAMGLADVRALYVRTAAVTGGAVLLGALAPVPAGYAPGMLVTIVPDAANTGAVRLDLNGLGERPLRKSGGLELSPGDLSPGVPSMVVFDGTAFLLLGDRPLPCPAGFSAGSRQYCVADSSRAPLDMLQANLACAAIGARLCTWAEWVNACRTRPGFMGTVLDYEWVDHAANHTDRAKRVGFGVDGSVDVLGTGCQFGGHAPHTEPWRFRCCMDR